MRNIRQKTFPGIQKLKKSPMGWDANLRLVNASNQSWAEGKNSKNKSIQFAELQKSFNGDGGRTFDNT